MLNIEKIEEKSLFRVTFTTVAEQEPVFIAGSFNDWDPEITPMQACGGNEYRAELQLPAGYYEYKFVFGNEWALDDSNPNFAPNDFGTLNSFFVLE